MGKSIRLIWVLAALVLAGAALTWPAASAVHSTGASLYVAPNGNDNNNCLSPATSCRTITAATRKATAGDTIYVAAGTYSKTSGETFPIQLPPRVSLIGSGPEITIVQGISDKPVLHIEGTSTPVQSDTVIRDLTFQNGDIGLYLHATDSQTLSPSLIRLRLMCNRVGILLSTGGDYYTVGAFVSPVISDTQVFSNTETGIAIDAYTFLDPCAVSPTIFNSVIRNNGGDGLFLGAASPRNTTCTAAPRIIQTRITDNGGNGIGSGLGGYGTSQPVIERSFIIGNKGWGISWGYQWLPWDYFPSSYVVNSVIARNQGGGVFLDRGYGHLQILNSTIADNRNYGIYWTVWGQNQPQWSISVTNTIIWNSLADDLAGGTWSTAQIRFSDIEDGDLLGQEGNISAAPLLTEDYHLSACSPAINAGTHAGAPSVDMDDESRPKGSAVDIGADEYEAPCWLSLSKQVSENRAQYGAVLNYTITLTNTTVFTPVNASLTDPLPLSLAYQSGSLQSSQGEASYNDGRITWSDTVAPGTTVTLTFQARVQRANTWVHNWVTVETGDAGTYVGRTETWVDPIYAYLPFVRKPRPGIYGVVTFNGQPHYGVFLELRFYDGSAWSTIATTLTNYQGEYVFENVPHLGPGQRYYVRFYNPGDQRFVFVWCTRVLTSYGGSADMGTFDIADVRLLAPANGATVGLPYTFRWQPRPATPTDTYEFDLYDPYDRNVYFYTPPLGYVGSYTLTGLPGGFSPDNWYAWEIWIYSPDGGFGISREARWVKFAGTVLTRAEEIQSGQPKPEWWVEEDGVRK
ncbi:MAG: right-handed parallel beta-helix repeat-containing protein [Anaerolineae bacterium]|nr:right-handed parallel beta-helix repeat-containing protein [Anaerolineae bacterium]